MKALAGCLASALLLLAQHASAFDISSPAIAKGKTIPDKYVSNGFGCASTNVSPPFAWKDAPEGAKSFALTIFDPDAPTGSGFWHWLVVNMPPTTTGLPEGAGDPGGAMPTGAVQARNDAGTSAYFGPCPPQGDKPHHYVVTIYAVKTEKLDIDPNTSGAVVGFMLHYNALAKASVTYTYGRK